MASWSRLLAKSLSPSNVTMQAIILRFSVKVIRNSAQLTGSDSCWLFALHTERLFDVSKRYDAFAQRESAKECPARIISKKNEHYGVT